MDGHLHTILTMVSTARAPLSKPVGLCIMLLLVCAVSFAADNRPSADELMQRGQAAAQQGALEEALVAWKEAAELYDQAGQARGQIQALSNAAYAARTLGHVNQAFLQQELALQLARTIGDPKWMTLTLSELGKTYVTSHQYDVAADYIVQAVEIAQAQKFPTLAAALQNDLGIVLALQGRLAEALIAFREARNASEGGTARAARRSCPCQRRSSGHSIETVRRGGAGTERSRRSTFRLPGLLRQGRGAHQPGPGVSRSGIGSFAVA